MIYDLDLYRHNIKPLVKDWCDNHKDKTPVEMVGALSLMTNCDIVIIAHYVGELYGFTDELNKNIKSLLEFYKPEAVINKE